MMKKLLVFLFLGFGLAQAGQSGEWHENWKIVPYKPLNAFEQLKNRLRHYDGLSYQGIELHSTLKQAADLINQSKDGLYSRELVPLVGLQFRNNEALNKSPDKKKTILNNFLQNIGIIEKSPDKKEKLLNDFLQNIDEQKRESVKKEINYYNKGLDLSFEREKKLNSIVYGAGLGISCLSFFKKPDLMYGGLATVFLTSFVLNNKKTTGMPYDRIKQQNKIWWNTLYSAGLIYSGFSLFKKPDLFNIGLATFSLTRLFYNNRNIDYDTSEGKKRHDEGMFDSILLTCIMTSGYSLHKKETNLNKALFASCLQLFVKNKLEGYK